MAGFFFWAEVNWFNLIQTAGIVGSLLMAAAAAIREAKAREIENLLKISEHHRELWNQAHQRKELQKIFRQHTDGVTEAPSVVEEEFINLILVHLLTTWRISRTGGLIKEKELALDVRGFLSLPLPCAVWEKTKQFRNPKFVRFVERAMKC